MKNKALALLAFMVILCSASAQYSMVNFNHENANFNDNQPLPAEKSMMFTGSIPKNIDLVEINIFTRSGKENRRSLATGRWKRPHNNLEDAFRVPMNFKLKESKKYDFRIDYYSRISLEEKQELFRFLTGNLDAYLNQTLEAAKKKIQLTRKSKQVMLDMKEVVVKGLSAYRCRTNYEFPGFSDIVTQKVEQIEKVKLKKGKYVVEGANKTEITKAYRAKLIEDLKRLVFSEVTFVMNNDYSRLKDSYYIEDYETESKPGYFSLNIGYGATYLSGNFDDLSYGTAPYIGLGFPLASSSIAPRFLRNASINIGVFLTDFEDADEKKVTGPIIKRPFFAGLDYRLFQFVRFNAGIAILESEKTVSGTGEKSNQIFVRPFVGFSAKINLSLSLDK